VKIISTDDKYIASTWGASISLKAGEPKEVSHELGLLCLQEGCTEYKGEIPTHTEEPVVEEPVVEEPVVEESSINLESMTKIQLEEHGRTLGIELDRRKKKATLIEEIKAAQ
tara:strand:+ start:254 stop:589 length:336 start_codon:yes stop_codon:yes gene_type:complete